MTVACEAGTASIAFRPSTISAAPAFVLFESWAPLTLPSRDVSRSLRGSVGREKIGGANASGAQLSNRRKAGAASVSMVTVKVGQPLLYSSWLSPRVRRK